MKTSQYPELEPFVQWLATQHGPYNAADPWNCPIADYWKAHDPGKVAPGDLSDTLFHPIMWYGTYEALHAHYAGPWYKRLWRTLFG